MAPADASASTRPRRPPAAMASSAFADLLDEWMPWSAVTLSTACPGIGAGAPCDHVGVSSAADGVIEMPPKTMLAAFPSISAAYHLFPHTSEF